MVTAQMLVDVIHRFVHCIPIFTVGASSSRKLENISKIELLWAAVDKIGKCSEMCRT